MLFQAFLNPAERIWKQQLFSFKTNKLGTICFTLQWI